MPTRDEWRKALRNDRLTDQEVDEFVAGLRKIICRILDDYLRDDPAFRAV